MKDDYKKLSHEWGSKRRKEDSRSAKSTLKKPTKEELAELEPEKHISVEFIDDGGDGIAVCSCGVAYQTEECPRKKS